MNTDRFFPTPGRGKTTCPECGRRAMAYDSAHGSAKCFGCGLTAKRVEARWIVKGDGSRSGADADDWLADVTAVFATSMSRAAGAGLRIALAMTPLIAVGGLDSIAPGSDWLSGQIGSGPQVVSNGVEWLIAHGLLSEAKPAARIRPATYTAHTVNASEREEKMALRENYLQWTADLSLTLRRIPSHLLRRDGVSVTAMQGWALVVLHGPHSGAEMSRASGLPTQTAQRRLRAAVDVGIAVETTIGAAKWYRLADPGAVADVADAAQARVARAVDRNSQTVAVRRDRLTRSRAAWRLERVACRADEYRPTDDALVEHLAPSEHERVAVLRHRFWSRRPAAGVHFAACRTLGPLAATSNRASRARTGSTSGGAATGRRFAVRSPPLASAASSGTATR